MKKALVLSAILILLLPTFVSALPDITIQSLSLETENPKLGDTLKIKAGIVNVGDSEAANIMMGAEANGNTRNVFSGMGPIPADGEEHFITISVETLEDFPPMNVGENTVKVIADRGNEVEESDETNNDKTITVTLAESGLSCSDGTLLNQCSESKPKYCIYDNGELKLMNLSSTCGCDEGYEAKWDNCYKIEDPAEAVLSDLHFTQPAENSHIVSNFNLDIYVQVTANVDIKCDFDGKVCNSQNTCHDIIYKSCQDCEYADYQKWFGASYDAVAGWDYAITATCRDNKGNEESAIITFDAEGDSTADNTPPTMTVEWPAEGVKHPSTTNLEFTVDELSHCEYTLASSTDNSGGAGHVSIPKYINNYDKSLSLVEGYSYTLTLECEDLNGNSASKTINFEGAAGGDTGGGGSSNADTANGNTGGGTSNGNSEQGQVNAQEQEQSQTQTAISEQAKGVKITPETASDNAIKFLEAEFESVELIEPTQEGETRRYRVTAKKQAKFLGLFEVDMDVEAEVDAETGEVIQTKAPWWSFLVR